MESFLPEVRDGRTGTETSGTSHVVSKGSRSAGSPGPEEGEAECRFKGSHVGLSLSSSERKLVKG